MQPRRCISHKFPGGAALAGCQGPHFRTTESTLSFLQVGDCCGLNVYAPPPNVYAQGDGIRSWPLGGE